MSLDERERPKFGVKDRGMHDQYFVEEMIARYPNGAYVWIVVDTSFRNPQRRDRTPLIIPAGSVVKMIYRNYNELMESKVGTGEVEGEVVALADQPEMKILRTKPDQLTWNQVLHISSDRGEVMSVGDLVSLNWHYLERICRGSVLTDDDLNELGIE